MGHNFLPIAKRELRAAAWHKNTYRLRWWTVVLAIVASFIWLASASAPARFISTLFDLQTACAFGFALLAGAFLTADCLSEEKRDGTLNLLFLTNLKARDVVLGKFVGGSLSALYVLLALLPVTALPLLLGGVGFAEFWRMALALVNTMFFSLALGLGASALVTNYVRGLALTLGLLAVFGVGLPALDALAATPSSSGILSGLSSLSPFCPFWCAREARYAPAPHRFWTALLASHGMAWAWLALANHGVNRAWRTIGFSTNPSVRRSSRPRREFSVVRRRSPAGAAFDPALRLAGDIPLLRWTAWLIVAVWGGLVCGDRFWLGLGLPDVLAARLCGFLLKALFAFQACRFFVETRRSGAIELLMCTPLRNTDLLQAQWRALLRIFCLPLAVFLVFSWMTLVVPSTIAPVGFAAPAPGALPDFRNGFPGTFLLTFGLAADVLALGWFGMWLALTARKPGLAPGLTILAVLVLPAVFSPFDLVADMLFISWGTARFQQEFRWMVASTLSVRRSLAA